MTFEKQTHYLFIQLLVIEHTKYQYTFVIALKSNSIGAYLFGLGTTSAAGLGVVRQHPQRLHLNPVELCALGNIVAVHRLQEYIIYY